MGLIAMIVALLIGIFVNPMKLALPVSAIAMFAMALALPLSASEMIIALGQSDLQAFVMRTFWRSVYWVPLGVGLTAICFAFKARRRELSQGKPPKPEQ